MVIEPGKHNLIPSYDCFGYLVKVVDGDTVKLRCDLGQSVWVGPRNYRLFGINAPEMRTDLGKPAANHLAFLLAIFTLPEYQEEGNGFKFLIRTHKKRSGQDKVGKYGRYLIEIIGIDKAGELVNLNHRMVRDGHAVEKVY